MEPRKCFLSGANAAANKCRKARAGVSLPPGVHSRSRPPPGPARSCPARKRHRGPSGHPHLHGACPRSPSNSPARRQDPSSHLPSATCARRVASGKQRHSCATLSPAPRPASGPQRRPPRPPLGQTSGPRSRRRPGPRQSPAPSGLPAPRWAGLLPTQLRPRRSSGQWTRDKLRAECHMEGGARGNLTQREEEQDAGEGNLEKETAIGVR